MLTYAFFSLIVGRPWGRVGAKGGTESVHRNVTFFLLTASLSELSNFANLKKKLVGAISYVTFHLKYLNWFTLLKYWDRATQLVVGLYVCHFSVNHVCMDAFRGV